MTILATLALLLAAPPTADPLIGALQAKLDTLQSLSGRFVQRLDSKSLGRPRSEEGRFYLRKPTLMRWEYERPEEKLAIADGRHTWLYLPADREAHRGSLRDLEQGGTAALMLSGRIRLDRDFASRRLAGEELAAAGPQGFADAAVFELIPTRRTEEMEKVILAVEPRRLRVRRVSVVDALGDRLILELFDLEEDLRLDDALFRFEPPPGVTIIRDR